MIQRKYLNPVGLVVLLVGIWTLGWFWLAWVIETGLKEYAAQRTGNSFTVVWDEIDTDGYPNRLFTHITRPRVKWSTPDGAVEWAGPTTKLKFFTDFGRTVSFQSPGRHIFVLPYLASYDDERMVAADSERLDGRIEFDGDGRITVLRGQASRLALALDRKPLTTLDDAAFDWSRNAGRHDSGAIHPDTAGQTLDFALSGLTLEATKLEPDIFGTLGRKLDRVAGQISLRGKLQHDRITAETLGRWRDAGGTLELADIIIDWGPLRLAGAGTLALDDALQPVGALTAQIAGLEK